MVSEIDQTIRLTRRDDNFTTTNTDNVEIFARAGNDVIRSGSGDDIINGQGGSDRLFGRDGNDHIVGGGGSDTLNGGNGDDVAFGGNGNDRFVGSFGTDNFVGGNGNDIADYSDLGVVTNFLQGGRVFKDGLGTDQLGSLADVFVFPPDQNDIVEAVIGNANSAADNTIDLSGGENASGFVDLEQGGPILGSGIVIVTVEETIVFPGGEIPAGEVIETEVENFANITGTDDFGDTLRGDGGANFIEGLRGDDTLVGRGGNDDLRGNRGDDTLNGGGGDDELRPGGGEDTINGGAGEDFIRLTADTDTDTVIYDDAGGALDTIRNFQYDTDTIVIDLFGIDQGDIILNNVGAKGLQIEVNGEGVIIDILNGVGDRDAFVPDVI